MFRNVSILLVTAAVIALPFIFRRAEPQGMWREGDPVLIVISPHNEAIRYEFGRAFSNWHRERFGTPVKVDWRIIGGTTEIMRYLEAEFVSAFRAWWLSRDGYWPAGGADMILDRKFKPGQPPADASPEALAAWERQRDLHAAFRGTDNPAAFGCKIDVFYGGGTYDHGKAAGEGLTVTIWPDGAPADTVATADGQELIPEALGGETWRTDAFYGTALSTFGICYNIDRLTDLGIEHPPRRWADLTDPRYVGQVGVADPTKSGSIAKAFEMIVHEQCWRAVRAAGFSQTDAAAFEDAIAGTRLPPGELPAGVPPAYQQAIEAGWLAGMRLVQAVGANARYFTDGASKVPIDVSMGDAAAGLAIDFYGRYQAEVCRGPDGTERMFYVTPVGGSSVSADPISLLRGAEHAELARRFIAFTLSPEGQRLWNYAPGTPGGPEKFALRRLPIRRDFYPPLGDAHRAFTVDDLADPSVNPFTLAEQFVYHGRWTGAHFSVQRDLIRAMCLDAGDELRAAWKAILAAGGPERCPQAFALLQRMPDRPEPLTWISALRIPREHARLDYMRDWTRFFRDSYREAGARAAGEDR
jgi:iron(III) transport system substrate-binding protein